MLSRSAARRQYAIARAMDTVASARLSRVAGVLATALLAACGESAVAPDNEEPPRQILAPPCANPAPLNHAPNVRYSGYLVRYRLGTDATAETTRLARVHGFSASTVFLFTPGGFAARLTPEQLAALRCEPTIDLVEHDLVMTIAGARH